MGSLTQVPGHVKLKLRPLRAGWFYGRLSEGGQPQPTALRVAGSSPPASREGGIKQAATSRPWYN